MAVNFSTKVTRGLNNKLRQDIMESVEGTPAMRKEIRRVFQMANRRIQNIEKSGVFSPAVASLGKGDIHNYSKFSIKGFGNTGAEWTELKKEYAKAIAFLNQPTSSATGAREFEEQVKKQMDIDEELWDALREQILMGYNSVESQLLLALPYADFMQEIYSRTVKDVSSKMEEDAKKILDKLDKNINKTSEDILQAYEDLLNGFKL